MAALIAAAALGGTPAAAVDPPRWDRLIVDINRGEFIPSRRLTLTLDTGRYMLDLADPPWRGLPPQPPRRTGTLGATDLARIRRLVDRALDDNLVSSACVSRRAEIEHAGGYVWMSGGPHHVALERPGARLVGDPRCPSDAAIAIERMLDTLFPPYRAPAPVARQAGSLTASISQSWNRRTGRRDNAERRHANQ